MRTVAAESYPAIIDGEKGIAAQTFEGLVGDRPAPGALAATLT